MAPPREWRPPPGLATIASSSECEQVALHSMVPAFFLESCHWSIGSTYTEGTLQWAAGKELHQNGATVVGVCSIGAVAFPHSSAALFASVEPLALCLPSSCLLLHPSLVDAFHGCATGSIQETFLLWPFTFSSTQRNTCSRRGCHPDQDNSGSLWNTTFSGIDPNSFQSEADIKK